MPDVDIVLLDSLAELPDLKLRQSTTVSGEINQAQIDSVDISYSQGQIRSYAEDMVNELILQAGSLQKFESQEGRPAFEIKDEIINRLEEYQYAQDMMATVTRDINVTPGEVERHFRVCYLNVVHVGELKNSYFIKEEEIKPECMENEKYRRARRAG